ncbi:MAG: hypothetical protein KME16_16830 [Scytolyngbya sp. HA4215-MV1]|jgi:hypothetical protein|nr:hypothetical protein [Scytolyngbya sp. HA4215-MV1]
MSGKIGATTPPTIVVKDPAASKVINFRDFGGDAIAVTLEWGNGFLDIEASLTYYDLSDPIDLKQS